MTIYNRYVADMPDITGAKPGSPEYILPLLVNLRNRWMREENDSAIKGHTIGMLNILIINVELMIDTKSK